MRAKTKEQIEGRIADNITICGMSEADARADAEAWGTPRHPMKEYTYSEIKAEPDEGWLVGDNKRPVLLSDAVWMDFGPEKAGKTYHALEVAFCVAFGLPYYGLPVKQGNVVYVITEGHIRRIAKRVSALWWKYATPLRAQGYKTFADIIDAGKFNLVASPIDLTAGDSADVNNSIKAFIGQLQHAPYVAVWLDTWTRMLAASGGHTSDMEIVPLALRGCDVLRERLGCSVVLVAHSPLGEGGRPKGLNEQTSNIDGATRGEKQGKPPLELFKYTSVFQRHAENDYSMVFKLKPLGADRVLVAEDGGFNDAKLADYPNALKALNLLRAIPGGASDKEWRASVKEAGLLDGKNPRQQWAALRGRLTTEDAVDFESSTKWWTARTPTPAAE